MSWNEKTSVHPAEERAQIRKEEAEWFANRDRCRCHPQTETALFRRRLRRYLGFWLCMHCWKLVT